MPSHLIGEVSRKPKRRRALGLSVFNNSSLVIMIAYSFLHVQNYCVLRHSGWINNLQILINCTSAEQSLLKIGEGTNLKLNILFAFNLHKFLLPIVFLPFEKFAVLKLLYLKLHKAWRRTDTVFNLCKI